MNIVISSAPRQVVKRLPAVSREFTILIEPLDISITLKESVEFASGMTVREPIMHNELSHSLF